MSTCCGSVDTWSKGCVKHYRSGGETFAPYCCDWPGVAPIFHGIRPRAVGGHSERGLMAMAGFPYIVLRDAILAHPTMAEGLSVLLAGVPTMTEPRAPTRREGVTI
jgi:hypothetical protein